MSKYFFKGMQNTFKSYFIRMQEVECITHQTSCFNFNTYFIFYFYFFVKMSNIDKIMMLLNSHASNK